MNYTSFIHFVPCQASDIMDYITNVDKESITYTYAKHTHGYAFCPHPYICISSHVYFYVWMKIVLLFNAMFVPIMALTVAMNHFANRLNFICTLILWGFEGEVRSFFSASVLSSLTLFPTPSLFPIYFTLPFFASSFLFPYAHILQPTLFIKKTAALIHSTDRLSTLV